MSGFGKSRSFTLEQEGDKGKNGYSNEAFRNDLELVEVNPNTVTKNGEAGGHAASVGSEYDIDDHKIPLEQLLKRYNTNATRGLNDAQVTANREKYGRNELTPPPKPSQLWKFVKAVCGGLNALLWGCSFLSYLSFGAQYLLPGDIVYDNLYLACALVFVVHVSGAFSFYQEFKSDRIMESFKNMVPRAAYVTRNGRRFELDVVELVVGDIVEVKFGDLIPADIRILSSQDFKVDNSSLTGESEPCKRSAECTSDSPMETKNMAFFSTNALEGVATAIVVRAGSNTLMGRLANLASTVDSGESPIGVEMDRFIMIMTIRSLVFGGFFFILALVMHYKWTDAVFFVIGIVVANVPEGLAVTFTMILAVTAKRMAKKNCLVKHLHAVEALGSTSVICTDKTGTLTQNKMSVAHMWFNNEIGEADTSEFYSGQSFDNNDPGFQALSNVACLCSRANFKPGQENVPVLMRIVEGDASETAILKCMENQVGNVVKYRSKYPKLCEIPFNSTNKFQVSIHDLRDPDDPRYLLVMKGAPERIIGLCKTILIKDVEYEIDDEWKEAFNLVYHTLGTYGERVLGFCDCRLPLDEFPVGYEFDPDNTEFLKVGFRFVGLISMIDPPKATVPDAVAKCRSAGIKVVMVTGDHPVTATAIARAVGIISEGNQTIEELAISQGCSINEIDPTEVKAAVISGAELKQLSPEELRNVLINHDEIVFARTSPEQKYTIVEAFQNLGHIVAATGDGVNDSPALKKADIGVAMGISGSEVSKETANLILMDDNFASIAIGVEEGRLIFDNLKKLIQYNLADNIAEMYSVMVFIVTGIPLPMGTIAMLLSVLGTDVLPAISIAHETAEADIMKLKPRNPATDKLVTPQLLRYTYLQTSVIELASGYFCWLVYYWSYGWSPARLWFVQSRWDSNTVYDLVDSYDQEWSYDARQKLEIGGQTAFFISIVITQIGNVIICKTRRMSLFQKGMRNWRMNFSIIWEIALAIFLVNTPYLNGALKFNSINPVFWLAPIPFAFYMVFYDEVRKFIIRMSKGGWYSVELTT